MANSYQYTTVESSGNTKLVKDTTNKFFAPIFGIDTNGDGYIGSPAGNPYISIESSGNTKLVKDTTNKFFAQVGQTIPTAINNGGQQIFQNIYAGWQTLAAETVNSQNQVLWKNTAGDYLHIWRLDNNWNWVSSEGKFALNSAAAFTQETNFGIDTNGDGIIGSPYTTVESSGNTKLVKDTANKFFAQVGTNTPTAINNGGQQIFQGKISSLWFRLCCSIQFWTKNFGSTGLSMLNWREQGTGRMSDINDFKDLIIWQKGMDIAQRCYFLTKLFPKDELYGMVQQIRRSAVSIPANISEGYGRRYRGEYIRFLNIAQGSVNELETHLILSHRVGLCSEKDVEMILNLLKKESRMIISLIKKLEN